MWAARRQGEASPEVTLGLHRVSGARRRTLGSGFAWGVARAVHGDAELLGKLI